ncbi:hypothetical protein F2Q68_00023014 [Brassica cretica]|uniref:Hyaluronan/mRNA-binding protein domain-containing protein n=1 Tax=Brassica cretica TaxID=69181 RepID=A0A8S9FXZ2_BRACR|nr:hypothetical protein F2Q68_00023014 [Brassica cretica]
MATLNPFDLLDDGAEDLSQIAVSIGADKPKKPAPVSAVSAKSSVPSRQLAQPVREAMSDAPRGGGSGGGDGGFSRGGYNRDFRGGDGNSKPSEEAGVSKPSEEAGVSKPLYEKRSVYGSARRGGGRRGEAGDGERPRRTFERHSGTGREGDIKSEEAGCGNWGTPGEEVVVVDSYLGEELGEERARERELVRESSEKRELVRESSEKRELSFTQT